MLKKILMALICFLMFSGTSAVFAEDGIIDLNTATVEDLMGIEDIDIEEDVAKAIILYRDTNGPFKSADDFTKVPGMTQDFLEDLNPQETEDGKIVFDPDAEPALAPSKC